MSLILSGTDGLSDVDGSAATPAIRGTDANTGIFFPAADTIAFAEGGAEVARFDSSGNFGLGVTPSAWSAGYVGFQVKNASLASYTSGAYTWVGSNWYNNSGNKYIGTGFATLYEQTDGKHAWLTAASGTAGNAITFTQAMTLDASGRLGIGETAPDRKLTLLVSPSTAGDDGYKISDGTRASTFCRTGATYSYQGVGVNSTLLYSSNTLSLLADGSSVLSFHNGNGETARINSSGNFLSGLTTYTDGSMFYKSSLTALNCWRGSTTASEGVFGVFSNTGGSGTVRAYFRVDGGLANYSANDVNLSDERLKKDITLAGNYLDKICAIPVKNFRYKDQSETEDITLGVIAQDVQAIAPELVSNDGFGVNEENQQDYLSIYQTDMQYALMKCIQEQQALIVSMREEIDALKTKVGT